MGEELLPISIAAIACSAFAVLCVFAALTVWAYDRWEIKEKRARMEARNVLGNSALSDSSQGTVQGWKLLRPQRKTELNVQGDIKIEYTVEHLTDPGIGVRASHTMEENLKEHIQQTSPTPINLEAGARVSGPTTEFSPQLSNVAPGVHPHSRVSSTYSGDIYTTQPFAYQPTPIVDEVTFQPSTSTVTGSIYSSPDQSAPQYAHRRSTSTNTMESWQSAMYMDSIYPVSTLPSYPGTARSASPPSYFRVRSGSTRASSHRELNHTVGTAEPMPDFTRLEK